MSGAHNEILHHTVYWLRCGSPTGLGCAQTRLLPGFPVDWQSGSGLGRLMPNLIFVGASWASLCLLRELQATTVAHTVNLMCAGICTESRCAHVFFWQLAYANTKPHNFQDRRRQRNHIHGTPGDSVLSIRNFAMHADVVLNVVHPGVMERSETRLRRTPSSAIAHNTRTCKNTRRSHLIHKVVNVTTARRHAHPDPDVYDSYLAAFRSLVWNCKCTTHTHIRRSAIISIAISPRALDEAHQFCATAPRLSCAPGGPAERQRPAGRSCGAARTCERQSWVWGG